MPYNLRMHPPAPLPPDLDTEDLPPSWLNGGGHHVDRSACFELRASEAVAANKLFASPRAGLPAAIAFPFLDSTHEILLTADSLQSLLHKREPFRLLGDFRTPKSRAMRSPHHPLFRRRREKTDKPWRSLTHPHQLPFDNPNRGVKILGLDPDWIGSVVVQFWRHNPRLLYPYLLCPACEQKKKMLYLPMCTEREFSHSRIAWDYLRVLAVHPATRNRPPTQAEILLRKRYATLFPPRQLVCKGCLGMRYGYARFTSQHELAAGKSQSRRGDPARSTAGGLARSYKRSFSHFDPFQPSLEEIEKLYRKLIEHAVATAQSLPDRPHLREIKARLREKLLTLRRIKDHYYSKTKKRRRMKPLDVERDWRFLREIVKSHI